MQWPTSASSRSGDWPKTAVRRGYGIAAFSRLALTEELANQTLVVIPFMPWSVRRVFSIVRIRDATLSWPAQELLTTLRTLRPSAFDVQGRVGSG